MSVAAWFRGLLNPPSARLEAEVHNQTRANLVAAAAQVANTGASRNRGLLQHDSLPEGHGLWIVPCSAVHSFGMKFDIDVVYLDQQYRVRKVRERMTPARISACLGAHSVLELPAGTIVSSGTRPGDQLELRLRQAGGAGSPL